MSNFNKLNMECLFYTDYIYTFLFSGPLVDCSVRVTHLDRNEIITRLGLLVDEGQGTERLGKSLAKQLKQKHPIHNMVVSLTNAELNQICANLSLPIPKHRERKMKAISNHFFREYPDAPLTNLEKIMEEDAYFAQLTSEDDARPTSIVSFKKIFYYILSKIFLKTLVHRDVCLQFFLSDFY